MQRNIVTGLILIALAVLFGFALVHGVDKTLDIKENTYYDKELGRMVYVESGV